MDKATYDKIGKIFDEIYKDNTTHARWQEFLVVLDEHNVSENDWFKTLEYYLDKNRKGDDGKDT